MVATRASSKAKDSVVKHATAHHHGYSLRPILRGLSAMKKFVSFSDGLSYNDDDIARPNQRGDVEQSDDVDHDDSDYENSNGDEDESNNHEDYQYLGVPSHAVVKTDKVLPLAVPMENEVCPSPSSVQRTDIPANGNRDIDRACGERYCHLHDEIEYLMQSPDQWMHAQNFTGRHIPQKLAHMLRAKTTRRMRIPAECSATLWSRIGEVVGLRQEQDNTLYHIRWRPTWTVMSGRSYRTSNGVF